MPTFDIGDLNLSCTGTLVTCSRDGQVIGEARLSEDGLFDFEGTLVCVSQYVLDVLSGREAPAEPEREAPPAAIQKRRR
jgi:hypothetical protein